MPAPLSEAEKKRRLDAYARAVASGAANPGVIAAKALKNISAHALNVWLANLKDKPSFSAPPAPQIAPIPPASPREIRNASFWRTKFNDAEKARINLELLAEKLGGIRDIPIDAAPWTRRPVEPKKTRSIAIAHTSDIHAGEVIDAAEVGGFNSYNSRIAEERMARYFAAATTIPKRWMADNICDGALLTMAGDLISGSIHAELEQTNDLTSHEQVALIVSIYERGIKELVQAYGAVHVVAVPGNHGRTTVKPTAKLSARLSYDILAASILRDRMKADKRVTWAIASGFDVRVPLYGRSVLVTHGDRIGTGGGQGFAGPVLPILRGVNKVRLQAASAGQDYDLVLMGHFHISAAVPGALSNGSVPGHSEYGHGLRASVEPPKQWLGRFSSEWGLCEMLAVQLADAPNRWRAKDR